MVKYFNIEFTSHENKLFLVHIAQNSAMTDFLKVFQVSFFNNNIGSSLHCEIPKIISFSFKIWIMLLPVDNYMLQIFFYLIK